MNIELLCRNALSYLKETYSDFPTAGFIAGGSLSNLIWQEISGNLAKINDIDVFILDSVVDRNPYDSSNWVNSDKEKTQKLYYHKKETIYFEDYQGLTATSKSKDFYYIEKTTHEGIYNTVYYCSNISSPQVIIDSFDINCTQVGYSIDEDKFYYTEDFIDFLKTGELRLVNLMSPAHSAIRIVKKKNDLNAKLDELELKMCQFCLSRNMSDTNRRYFTVKYQSIWKKYESELSNYFNLIESDDVTILFKNKGIDIDIWTLESKQNLGDVEPTLYVVDLSSTIFNDPIISEIHNGQNLIFYIRNIRNNIELKEIWKKLKIFFKRDDYVDTTYRKEDIEMLNRMVKVAPNTIENLKGLKLSQQLWIMKTLFDKYKDDPIIAISIMEKIKIEPNREFDENDFLLLELSVRKEIVNDVKQKANRILKS
jgi:hypothetical protein